MSALAAGLQLLPVARHDEQRVVDRQPEPDQLDDVGGVGRERDDSRRGVEQDEAGPDRAGGKEERDDERCGDAEDGGQDDERHDESHGGAAAKVGRELRVQVVRDGGLTADERWRPDAGERTAQRLRVALGSTDLERRGELAVSDAAAGAEGAEAAARKHRRRAREPQAQLPLYLWIGGVTRPEDDREAAFRPLTEAAGERCRGPVRLGARDGVGVDEVSRKHERRRHAGGGCRGPAGKHDPPDAQHDVRQARERRSRGAGRVAAVRHVLRLWGDEHRVTGRPGHARAGGAGAPPAASLPT
jgi:hypothetical protein